MVKILVTYHSKTGHTEELAKAVVEGVKEIGGIAVLKKGERS